MARKHYHDWWYYLEEGDVTVKRVLVDRKGAPRIGDGFVALDGTRWKIWYVEQGRGVRNARLERTYATTETPQYV